MSDPEPIDLSQLQNLNLAPDWVGDLQKREGNPGEVVWGRAPSSPPDTRGPRGLGKGGPRHDDRRGGGFGGDRGNFPRQDRNGPRGPGRDGPRNDGPRGPRNDGPRPGGPPRDDRRGGGERRGGGRPEFRNDRDRRGHFEDRPQIFPLEGWRARLLPEPRSLEAIVRQVKASGRAYPVFELGRLFLAGRDRYVVEFSRIAQNQPPRPGKGKGPRRPESAAPAGDLPPEAPANSPPAPLPGPEKIYQLPVDDSLWIQRDDAIRHILHTSAFHAYYRKETVSVDPPKGSFTAVAVCGFSGEILGPPNHHSFQTTVARLHREQFYNLPIDRYKARIRTEKDEALVAKWLESQSTSVVYFPYTAAQVKANLAAEREKSAKSTPPAAGQSAGEATAPEASAESATPAEPEDTASQPDTAPTGEVAAAGDDQVSPEHSSADPASAVTPENTSAPDTPAESATETATAPAGELAGDPASAEQPEGMPAAHAEPKSETATDSAAENDALVPAEPEAATEPEPEPEPLKTWAAVESHFLAHHAETAVRAVSRVTVAGNIPGRLIAPSLLALLRMEVDQQQRFPMQLVQDLCRDLEKHSLKFFKRDKKATFVCRTRPHHIEDETHLSPRLRSIVGVVRANPGIPYSKLVSTLAPNTSRPAPSKVKPDHAPATPAPESPPAPQAADAGTAATEAAPGNETAPDALVTSTPAGATPPPAPAAEESTADPASTPPEPATSEAGPETPTPLAEPDAAPPLDTPPAESAATPVSPEPGTAPDTTAPDTTAADRPAAETPRKPRLSKAEFKAAKKAEAAAAAAVEPATLTADEIAVLQDLRWLVQEGFVTEFASGELRILGRPPQPPPVKAPRPAIEPPLAEPPAHGAQADLPVANRGSAQVPAEPPAAEAAEAPEAATTPPDAADAPAEIQSPETAPPPGAETVTGPPDTQP